MTLQDVKALLDTIGYPVAYRCFKRPQAPPFLCYLVARSNNFSADDAVYQKIDHIQIELYTDTKDPVAESEVEKALSALFWEKTEEFIESEQMHQIVYEIEVAA